MNTPAQGGTQTSTPAYADPAVSSAALRTSSPTMPSHWQAEPLRFGCPSLLWTVF